MLRERVRCATECSGVNWLPMDVLRGRAGGAVGLSTLVGWAGLCTGERGGAGEGGRWVITLRATGGFYLGAGWVLCSSVEYGGGGGLGRKMSRMRVRAYKTSV